MPPNMSQASKADHLKCVKWQYHHAKDKQSKGRILDAFCKVQRMDRKYAIKLLRGTRGAGAGKTKGRPRGGSAPRYGPTEIAVLKALWMQSEQPCGKRLKALLPLWVPSWERHHGLLEAASRQRLLSISAAQIDRVLRRYKVTGRPRRPGLANAVRAQIPLRTGPWDTSGPGWLEGDTVAHCGQSTGGCFAWSLLLTDIWSQWTEVRATWNRGDHVTHQRLEQIEADLPFPVLGFDSDNGGEFINGTVLRYYRQRERPVEVTRSRPYHKNDNAHVEQKNLTHVRQFIGYQRLEHRELVEPLNALLAKWSLWNNLFCPTMKLLKKERVGTRLKRVHEKEARTPCARLLESPAVSAEAKERLRALLALHDPMDLKADLEKDLKALWVLCAKLSGPEPGLEKEAEPMPANVEKSRGREASKEPVETTRGKTSAPGKPTGARPAGKTQVEKPAGRRRPKSL